MEGDRRFRVLGLLTVGAVFFLILVGGVVRASGAGMGCPDWPKCFGRWVPPTDESQLPADYQERYAHRGYGDTPFNPVKTWTEYVNRLIGVTIGLLIFLTLLASWRFRRVDPPVFWWSLAAFLLVAFQGWLGSAVVTTNLAPWMVTVHMVVALVIAAILIYVVVRATGPRAPIARTLDEPRLGAAFGATLALSLVQVVLGTQVREGVDEVAATGLAREDWVDELGAVLLVHRSLSLVVLALSVALAVLLLRATRGVHGIEAARVRRLAWWMVAVVAAEVVAGGLLYYLALPPILQPVHLLLAAALMGLQFALWVLVRRSREASRRPVIVPA
ncbi:MAG TPA: COX15/CtaA family protein [Thermoanaerobaculia bacterium]|nr:COX15/CtaA family protein [Thermoanaerobaculia bacterium]